MDLENQNVIVPTQNKFPIPKSILIALIIILILIFLLIVRELMLSSTEKQMNLKKNNPLTSVKFITPISILKINLDNISNWQTYIIDDVTFNFPPGWTVGQSDIPAWMSNDIYRQDINDPSGIYTLTFKSQNNLNKITSRPYTDVYEYLKVTQNIKEITIGGKPAVQFLPTGVVFFSPDSKKIITMEINTTKEGLNVEERQQLFEKILSTLKFFDPYSLDITNWQTYSNTQYGLEFKYPKNWRISDDLPIGEIGMGPAYSLGDYTVWITVSNNQNMLSSSAYLDKVINDAKTHPEPLIFSSRENLMIDGLPASKLIGVFAFDHNGEEIYIVKNNIVFFINYMVRAENQNYTEPIKNYDVVQKILSTIKFSNLDKKVFLITQKLINLGWYQSNSDTKLLGTPSDWVFLPVNGGGLGCWHKPGVSCK